MIFKSNQRVKISGNDGAVIGRIEELRRVSEVPEAAAGDIFGIVVPRERLRQLGAEYVASISYSVSPGNQILFSAVEIGGEWFDLMGQKLEIEIVGVCS